MSAILETQPGEELVCIEPFSAMPKDSAPDRKARRNFRVGERVRYLGYFKDRNLKDNPAGWMVEFQTDGPKDNRRYAATQTSFVTMECWDKLKKYFAKRIMIEPR